MIDKRETKTTTEVYVVGGGDHLTLSSQTGDPAKMSYWATFESKYDYKPNEFVTLPSWVLEEIYEFVKKRKAENTLVFDASKLTYPSVPYKS